MTPRQRQRRIRGPNLRRVHLEEITPWTPEHEAAATYNRELRAKLQPVEALIVPYHRVVSNRTDQTHNGIELVLEGKNTPQLIEFPGCKARPQFETMVSGYICAIKLPQFQVVEGKTVYSPGEWYLAERKETTHRVGLPRPFKNQEWPLTLVGQEPGDTHDRLLWVNVAQIEEYDLKGWFAQIYGRGIGTDWGIRYHNNEHFPGEKP